MSVITISRDAGSLGDEIARRLADDLGYKLLDPEAIIELLSAKGIEKPVIEQFDEKEPGFFGKYSENKDKFIRYLSLAILEESLGEGLVVLGLGGSCLFSSYSDVVRIHVTAPEELRIERISEKYESDRLYCRRLINQVDNDRRGFIKTFFGKETFRSCRFDLTVNTESVSVADSVHLIKEICRIKEKIKPSFRERLIEMRCTVKILYEKKIPVRDLNLTYDNGLLTIGGRVRTREDGNLCTMTAGEVEGVEEVLNKISHKSISNYNIQ